MPSLRLRRQRPSGAARGQPAPQGPQEPGYPFNLFEASAQTGRLPTGAATPIGFANALPVKNPQVTQTSPSGFRADSSGLYTRSTGT